MSVEDADMLRQPVCGENLDVVDVQLPLEDTHLITKNKFQKII